jgi:hypothetical protein
MWPEHTFPAQHPGRTATSHAAAEAAPGIDVRDLAAGPARTCAMPTARFRRSWPVIRRSPSVEQCAEREIDVLLGGVEVERRADPPGADRCPDIGDSQLLLGVGNVHRHDGAVAGRPT